MSSLSAQHLALAVTLSQPNNRGGLLSDLAGVGRGEDGTGEDSDDDRVYMSESEDGQDDSSISGSDSYEDINSDDDDNNENQTNNREGRSGRVRRKRPHRDTTADKLNVSIKRRRNKRNAQAQAQAQAASNNVAGGGGGGRESNSLLPQQHSLYTPARSQSMPSYTLSSAPSASTSNGDDKDGEESFTNTRIKSNSCM